MDKVIRDFNGGIADIINWLLNGGNTKKVEKSEWKQFAGLNWSKAKSVGTSCINNNELQITVITTATSSKTKRLKSIVTPTKKYIANLVQIIGKNVLLCATKELKSHKGKINIKPDQIIFYGAQFKRSSNEKIEGITIDICIKLST